jgi:glycosyltransferase involved in cell wall biosynthesis
LDSAVTIVLPVHNAERTLRPMVTGILDLAAGAGPRLRVAIVDDGSTDDTFETACELARDFPQVRVYRQPFQQGLGPALEQVRQRLRVEEVIVHDGIGRFDLDELASLLGGAPADGPVGAHDLDEDGRGSRRFAAVSRLNARMAKEHRAITSFRWLRLAELGRPRRTRSSGASRSDQAQTPAPLTNLGAATFTSDFPVVAL